MPVWGLWHTSPGRRGSWHPCPAGRPRSFGGWGTHAPIGGGRGPRTPCEIRDPGQETATCPVRAGTTAPSTRNETPRTGQQSRKRDKASPRQAAVGVGGAVGGPQVAPQDN